MEGSTRHVCADEAKDAPRICLPGVFLEDTCAPVGNGKYREARMPDGGMVKEAGKEIST